MLDLTRYSGGELYTAATTDPELFWVRELATAFFRAQCEATPNLILNGWSALCTYLQLDMGGEGRERFRCLFLNNSNRLIADETMGLGTINHAPVYPREVVRRALELDAASIILVHNHPSGVTSPSKGDVEMTTAVIAAAKTLGITVHDHVIVTRGEVVSMRSKGLI